MSAFGEVASEVVSSVMTWQFWIVSIGSWFAILAVNGVLIGAMSVPRVGGALSTIAVPAMMVAPTLIATLGILLLLPVMLLREADLGWAQIAHLGLFEVGKIAGLALLAMVVAAFLPMVGGSAMLMALVQAAVVLSLSLGALAGGVLDVVPDFMTIVVMFVSIAAVLWLVSLLIGFPLGMLTGGNEDAIKLVGLIIGSTLSYLAAAIYVGWIRVENFG